ncbi:MAG TPA: preprotein translocase subunit YajC [Nocardioidaceae bacterium]|nr:preprotein translocase subunit YajC [Nocardioidaceae bacterium]
MSAEDLAGIFPLVLIVLAFWFLVIRPARKRQQDMSRIQSSVEVGSEVMLSSGIYGTVVALADDSLRVEIAPGTAVKVARQAVVRVVESAPTQTEGPAEGQTPNPTDEQ